MPVVCPLASLQPRISSTLVRKTADVPLITASFSHAWITALRVSAGLSFES